MKVLVTGADGLLGNNLVRELLKNKFNVNVLLLPNTNAIALKELPVTIHYGDVSTITKSLEDAVSYSEAIFHCAAITELNANKDLMEKVNVLGTKNIIDLALKYSIKRLVFVGSASSFEYGNLKNPGTEKNSFSKIYKGMSYMETKHKAMNLVIEAINKKNLNAVIVAPTFMLGPFDTRPSSGELILKYLKHNLKFTSPGGRNFVHVNDVAVAMIHALTKGQTGECYLLGGKNLSYAEFFTKLYKVAGKNKKIKKIPRILFYLAGVIFSIIKLFFKKIKFDFKFLRIITLDAYYDNSKAINDLQMPQTSIDVAIKESIKSLKDFGYYHE